MKAALGQHLARKLGISVLQLQELNSAKSHVISEEGPELKNTGWQKLQLQPFETLCRRSNQAGSGPLT